LYLRDHASAIVAGPQTGLAAIISGTLEGYVAEEPPGWFEHQLRRGKCLILLDGLDEVATHDDRSRVVEWVDRQIKQYPENDFIITSRPHGYQSTPLDGASVLQMRRFTDEQVGRFLRRWYLAVERHSSTNATDGNAHDRAEAAADDLLKRLGNAPALYDLTVNPLLLTMIANVHRYRGALPASRADLYGEICEVLLWRRQEAKRLTAELRGDQKEVVLQNLAFIMMQRRVRDLARSELLKILEAELPRLSTVVTAEDFLREASTSGLVIERENAVFAFAHQTFQEYLAATHIRETGKTSILTEAVGDPWWREATLLYVARADGSPVVEACLARGSVSALALAFDCADQARELVPHLRGKLDGLLADAWGADIDPERRRLMMGVTVARHLRDRIRLAGRSTICLRPITAGIYRLFVSDMEARGEHRVLDGPDPTDPRAADAAAVGMRASDARSFVAWLNDLSSGESVYRLPTQAEIDELAVQRTPGILEGSIWLAPTGEPELPQLWTPPSTNHPCAIDGQAIRESLTADVQNTPLLVALLLIRSRILLRIRARALHRHRNRALLPSSDLALDLDHPLALAHTRATAHDIPRILAIGSDLDLDLDRNPSPAFRALDGDLALVHALQGERGPAIASTVALVVDLELALMLGLALEFVLDRNLDPKLATALIECLDRVLYVAGGRQLRWDFDPPNARELKQALAPGRDLHQDAHVKNLLGSVRGRVRDVARARDLITARDPITAHDLVYVQGFDWAEARSLARTNAVDRDFEDRLIGASPRRSMRLWRRL